MLLLQKLNPEKVFHVVVAPCFDKKFEAVREEFYNILLESRDVDCVLTSGRLLLPSTVILLNLLQVRTHKNKSVLQPEPSEVVLLN